MPIELAQFVRSLVDSALMSDADVQAFLDALPADQRPADAEQLAQELVLQKKLTRYQARRVGQGEAQGLVLGNYVILDELGQGGMGVVFKAQHKRMQRLVALKVLAPAAVNSPSALKRFQREAQAAARLIHSNIVTAFDADEGGGRHFLVMEYVEGSDLASLVKNSGPLDIGQAIDCIVQAARGLQYAHQHGVVHRDIKPHNLMLVRSQESRVESLEPETRHPSGSRLATLDSRPLLKILDMGLARIESGDPEQSELTGSGQIMGTVDYMAPEQARNTRHADQRADVYSLGMTLWYLLTGRAAYGGDTVVEKLLAHQSQPIPSLSAARADVPPALEAIFQKMVSKRVEERYQSMNEVLAALEPWRADTSFQTASRPGEESRLGQWAQGVSLGATASRVMVQRGTATDARLEPTLSVVNPMADTEPQTQEWFAAAASQAALRSARRPWRASRKVTVAAGAGGLLLAVLGIFWAINREPRGHEQATRPTQSDSVSPAPDSSPRVEPAQPASLALLLSAPEDGAKADIDVPLEEPRTVEFWARPVEAAALDTPGGYVVNLQRVHQLRLKTAELNGAVAARWTYKIEVGGPELAKDTELNAPQPADLDRWTHVAAVYDTRQARLYVDGNLVATLSVGSVLKGSTNASIYIGAVGKSRQAMRGTVREVRVSSTARYTADFTPAPRFDPDKYTLALYHCDEGHGRLLNDSSGSERHAKIAGGSWAPIE